MSGRYSTEQAFFDDRQRLICGCISRCSGHADTAPLKSQYAAEMDHANRAIIDVRMDKQYNPKGLPARIMSVLISADICPNCLGKLDAGRECKDCEFWAQPWMDNSTEINDAAFDRREG